jgi:hypothetical protein
LAPAGTLLKSGQRQIGSGILFRDLELGFLARIRIQNQTDKKEDDGYKHLLEHFRMNEEGSRLSFSYFIVVLWSFLNFMDLSLNG